MGARVRLFYRAGELLDCLTNDLQIANYGILSFPVR